MSPCPNMTTKLFKVQVLSLYVCMVDRSFGPGCLPRSNKVQVFHFDLRLWGHSMTTWTQFCPFFCPPATSTWTFLTLNVYKNRDFLDHLTPLIVHVVIECPLLKVSKSREKLWCSQFFQKTNKTHYSEYFLFSKYAQDSEFRLCFGRVENTINCFLDLLTFK